jgi:hypothetical protein
MSEEEFHGSVLEILQSKIKQLQEEQKLIICHENCQCHNGVPFDQCECRCDYYCGEHVSIVRDIVSERDNLKEQIEKITLTINEEIGCAELGIDSFDEDTEAFQMFRTRINILKEIKNKLKEIIGVEK